jgi:hypothetical protein
MQPTHASVAGLQAPIGQSALERHPTHVFDTGSHLGVEPAQDESLVHATHAPCFMPLLAHAGVAGVPLHSELVVQGWQVCVEVWQTGFMPAQFAFVSQPTQVPEGVSQTLVDPVHWPPFVAEHWPHAPAFCVPAGWQAGVGAAQLASLVHCWQTLFLQVGIVPPQSAAARHWTHVFVARLQRGSGALQLASAVHSTQVPRLGLPASVSQMGPGSPTQSAFDVQTRHVFVPWSQIGIADGQSVS